MTRCERPKQFEWATIPAAGLIVLAAVLAYWNSFGGPLIFDGQPAIAENPTIGRLWPIWKPLCPPNHGETVTGRPLLNLSFAVNYAVSGLDVRSYHVANLAIHVLAALLLFGILRRTLLLAGGVDIPVCPMIWDSRGRQECLPHRYEKLCLALAIALLWAIHPLQTESVTYIVQRAESLVGLFYLLTLYCFIRGATSGRGRFWYAAAVLACLLGMASKEVMVSAPLMVLLYDRAFLAGSFGAAWRRRHGVYLALAATWLLLGWLVIVAGNRGGSAGFGAAAGSWAYLCTQFGAIVHYLKLSVWPHPLLLDYGRDTVPMTLAIVPNAILVAVLGLATLVALWRWPKVGFLGAWFFAILAPTSSIVPVTTQVVAEHRMYLPLAAVVTAVTLAGYLVLCRVGQTFLSAAWAGVFGVCAATAGALALGTLTYHRNADYHSELSIWQDTVDKAPRNTRAHYNLGKVLAGRGQVDEAVTHYREALEIKPDDVETQYSIGCALAGCGRVDEAITHYRKALEIKPGYAAAHNNLGLALASRGRLDEAIAHFQQAVKIEPDLAGAHNNLGDALASRGQVEEGITHLRQALEIEPDDAATHNNLGNALLGCGQVEGAITHYRKALEIRPNYAEAHDNLGRALAGRGQIDEAITHYRKALEIEPDDFKAHYNLAGVLTGRGQVDEAVAHYRKALEIRPDFAEAHNNLGGVLAGRGQVDEAIAHYRKALEIAPDYAAARHNLDIALLQRGRILSALAERRESLRLRPNDVVLLNDTAWLLATDQNASVRNGAEAVELAGRAVRLSNGREPAILGTLAAAYAETGRFPEAVQTARKALELAVQQNNRPLTDVLPARIALYEAGKPFRQPTSASGGTSKPK